VAATLPQAERRARELPFWSALAKRWGWHRVADAGCGAGFHLGLLRDLGVGAVGFDLALAALRAAPRHSVCAGDVLAPPVRPDAFDAVLCLGNTISLLPDRAAQRRALAVLAALLRPGGVLVLQGEDAARNVAGGPVVRTRRIDAETVHVRVFERRGRRVRMLASVAPTGGEAPVEETLLMPTSAATIRRTAGPLELSPVEIPAPPPGSGAAWWVALVKTGDGGRATAPTTHPTASNAHGERGG
jgi:SAM-dependent methyltransferase